MTSSLFPEKYGKLAGANIFGLFYNVLRSMYSDNYIHIKIGDNLSDQVAQNIGLRQVDNLSPILFKLFLNNLPSCFDASDGKLVLENVKFTCLMYADDLVLLSETEKGLQSCLSKLSVFYTNELTVNLKKKLIYLVNLKENLGQSFCLIMLKLRTFGHINI